MFVSGTFVLSLVGLVLGASSKRSLPLSVSLSAPSDVQSLDGLQITANVTNTSPETLRLLKYATVLDPGLPTRSFVVSRNGSRAAFTGLRIHFDMNALDDDSFVVIPSGKSVFATHDISALYDFESAGPGDFTIEPVARFQVFDDGFPAEVQASYESLTIHISGDMAKRELIYNKRATVACSDAQLSGFIAASYVEGQSLAATTVSYITANGANSLYRSYFGTVPTSEISGIFNLVATENDPTRTLNCRDPFGVCDGKTIAYTVTRTTDVYYCPRFYDEVATSSLCGFTSVAARNIRGATTLHELTHALAQTRDVGYGCSYDRYLAANDPASAANNADNYNCFATEVYRQTQCANVSVFQALVNLLVDTFSALRGNP